MGFGDSKHERARFGSMGLRVERRVEEEEGRDDQVGSWERSEFGVVARRGERVRNWKVDLASGSNRGNDKATIRGELDVSIGSRRYQSFVSWRIGGDAVRQETIAIRSG